MPKPRIEIIARGILIDSGRILVCRNRAGGYCYLPGGHVEFGEDSESALAREFMEECGTQVDVGRLLAAAEVRFTQSGRDRHEINLVFHVKHPGQHEVFQSLEPEIEFVWVPLDSLGSANFRPACLREWIGHSESTERPAWISLDERAGNPG